MEIFGQTAILVSDGTGSLVYHLVLLFALGTAAAIAVGRWSQSRQPSAARLAAGASALFGLRLAGLVVALLAVLLTNLNPLVLLPPFDRAASTLALLFIIWIVAFPQPNRLAEAATSLLSVLTVLGLAISWGLWAQEALAAGFYNNSAQETIWEAVQIGLLVGGLGLVALRRARDWRLGLAVLVILLAGHAIHYFLPIAGSSVPGAERLAEIVAVPLLVALIYRRAHAPVPAEAPATPASRGMDLTDMAPSAYGSATKVPLAAEDSGPLSDPDRTLISSPATLVVPAMPLDARAALALAALGSSSGPREFGEKLVVAAAHGLDAPLTFLLTPDATGSGLTVSNAYQMAGQRSLLAGFPIGAGDDDLLAGLERAEAFTWQPGPQEEELRDLALSAGVSDLGPLLLAPIRPAGGALVGAVAVVAPTQAADWSGRSQPLLEGLASAGAAAWAAVAERDRTAAALDDAQGQLTTLQVELERSREMGEALSNQLQLQRRAEPVQAEQLQALEAERAQFQAAQAELEQRKLQEQVLRAELDMTRTALAISSQENPQTADPAPDQQAALDDLRAQLAALSADHAEQQTLVQRLTTELAEARAALAQANQDATTVAALAAAREAQNSEADDLRARLQALLGDYEEQQAVAQRLSAELEQVRAHMVQASQAAAQALDAQRQETDSLRATLEDMQGDHALRQTLTERLSAELEQARTHLAARAAAGPEVETAPGALLAAEARLAQQNGELLNLRQALAESERQRAAAVVALASAAPSAPVGKSVQAADMEVIASVTQELRQPMSSIVGYADLLLSESVGIIGALQRKFLERIKASSERIGVLLDDLMRVMDIDSGNLRLAHESVDLMRVVDDALHGCESLFQGKNLKLNCSMPPNLPPIQADRDALLQIFTHLLNNSGAASSSDSELNLTLRVETDRRTGGEEMHYLVVSITDTGGGIAPEDQPRVFSRLYRADAPLIAGLGDNGMGLSIAKALVEGHGGRIWVISEAGTGSTFYVLLPLEGKHAKVNGTLQR